MPGHLRQALVRNPQPERRRVGASLSADRRHSGPNIRSRIRSYRGAHRDGRLDDQSFEEAKAEAANLFASIGLVAIDDELLDRACALVDQHALRGYDAVQLSALLTYGRDGLTFACFDGQLKAVALAEGYAVFPGGAAAAEQ